MLVAKLDARLQAKPERGLGPLPNLKGFLPAVVVIHDVSYA